MPPYATEPLPTICEAPEREVAGVLKLLSNMRESRGNRKSTKNAYRTSTWKVNPSPDNGATAASSSPTRALAAAVKNCRGDSSIPSCPSGDFKMKASYENMKVSIRAVIEFLAYDASDEMAQERVDEIRCCYVGKQYVQAMGLAQKHARRTCDSKCRETRSSPEGYAGARAYSLRATRTILSLLLTAWESLEQFLSLQCRDAHRQYYKLRHSRIGGEDGDVAAQRRHTEVEMALRRKVDLSELCCASQRGLLLAQSWRRRIPATSPAA